MQKDAEPVHGSKTSVFFFNLLQWALAGTSPPDYLLRVRIKGIGVFYVLAVES
jgi:hypothetical protein